MAPPRNVLFITVDQWRGDCLSALGHPVVTTPDAGCAWPVGASCSPTTGPTRRRAVPPGPASTRAPTSTVTVRSSTAPRSTPASPTWRSWPGSWAMTPCSSGTPILRSIPRTVPPGDPRLFTYEGVLPGFRAVVHDPWEAGEPGVGCAGSPPRASTSRQNPHRPLQAHRGLPGLRLTTVRRGRRPGSPPNSRRPGS